MNNLINEENNEKVITKKAIGRPKKIIVISNEEQNKIYYKTFKTKNDVNKMFVCENCGGHYTYYNKYKHLKTAKHLKTNKHLKAEI
jgi:hypothetical protein